MRYGIISDIHGNLEALEAVIHSCRQEGVEIFLCAGDIVGYGANPRECLDLIQAVGAVCVAGNHDWAVAGRFNIDNLQDIAAKAVFWTKHQLSVDHVNFLGCLDLVFKNEDVTLVHGSLAAPETFPYIYDTAQTQDTFYLMEKNVCFIGHTHIPHIFFRQGGLTTYAAAPQIEIKPDVKYLVNTGSVGQPRDGSPMASYGLYDTQVRRLRIERVSYDVATARQKILAAGLPEILAHRLALGQ